MEKQVQAAKRPVHGGLGLMCGVVLAVGITAAAFFLLVLLMTYTELSMEVIGMGSLAVTALSGFGGGFLASHHQMARGLWWGLLTAGIYALLMKGFLCGRVGEGAWTLGRGLGLMVAVCCGGLGGILGINVKK